MKLSIEAIRLDGGTQPRAAIDNDVIQDYALSLMEGVTLPPVTVFYDGADYWLADGFHRYHASRQMVNETIEAEVKQGTRRDAVLYSVGANATHGLRRTNADKERAIKTLLNDNIWAGWSDREIARRCGVNHEMVGRLRLELSGGKRQIEPRYVERNGTTYTMNTATIGRPQEQQPETRYHEQFPNWNLSREPIASIIADETEEDEDTANYYSSNVHSSEISTIPEETSHLMQIMSSSDSPEWYTPAHIIDRVLHLFGAIDLDPCSNSHETPNVPAHTVYTREDNGLSKTWAGKVYMNPPYGREIGEWTEKLEQEFRCGNVREAIALVPGRIDTAWFQPLYAHLICTIKGRLSFSQAESGAPFPSVVIYMGVRREAFIAAFKSAGAILERIA